MSENGPDLAALRREYEDATLLEEGAASEPWTQFGRWLADAVASPQVVEANAMVLATVSEQGFPSARTVLLKEWSSTGFVFYTHSTSAKGRDLASSPACALLFEWSAMQRQVRIAGTASPVARDEVERYFASRPRAARLGAWASAQSSEIASRRTLDEAYEAAVLRFGASESQGPVPVPETWGGYRVRPHAFEFWQGRASRLHDRLVYEPDGTGWRRFRRAP